MERHSYHEESLEREGMGLGRTQNIEERLLRALFCSFPEKEGRWSASIALSGGIDSTTLAASVLKHYGRGIDLRPVVVGTQGANDIKVAGTVADALGLDLTTVILGPKDVLGAVGPVSGFTGTVDPVVISFTIPLYFVLRQEGPKDVIVGHGGDELFGGYARYLEVAPPDLQADLDSDLDLAKVRIEADRRMAEAMGKVLVTPFLEEGFIRAVRPLPPELKVDKGVRKVALRMMARALGLPDHIVDIQKKAAQYGSGVMKVLKDEARRKGLSGVGELVGALVGGP